MAVAKRRGGVGVGEPQAGATDERRGQLVEVRDEIGGARLRRAAGEDGGEDDDEHEERSQDTHLRRIKRACGSPVSTIYTVLTSLAGGGDRFATKGPHFAVARLRVVLEAEEVESPMRGEEGDLRRERPAPATRLTLGDGTADDELAEVEAT